MHIWGETLSLGSAVLLFLALGLALAFEFVNGFHDTANAVATVIYTHTLKPGVAVVWSGIWNLIGVLTSTGAVAYGVVALLPTELVINIASGPGFAMIFSLLISAIIWNFGTWYLGLPASSSHSLIGAIMGVALANSALAAGHLSAEGVNWPQAKQIGLSLLISPAIGFVGAALLLLLAKALIKNPKLYEAPEKDTPPPIFIRLLLVFTCTGVSFAHGSNDGQKGMGLVMLILIGLVPGAFALKLQTDQAVLAQLAHESSQVSAILSQEELSSSRPALAEASGEITAYLKTEHNDLPKVYAALASLNDAVNKRLNGLVSIRDLSTEERHNFRTQLYLVDEGLNKLLKTKQVSDETVRKAFTDYRAHMDQITKYIAPWVKVAVALALGLGTMIGWKRIVVTVGEKIGKSHLSYGQGASAELVAMTTIALADHYGLPVSTTHVLSSGVAGAMAANHSGLQMQTLRNLMLAWVLTLPVCILLGAAFFSSTLYVIFHVLRMQ